MKTAYIISLVSLVLVGCQAAPTQNIDGFIQKIEQNDVEPKFTEGLWSLWNTTTTVIGGAVETGKQAFVEAVDTGKKAISLKATLFETGKKAVVGAVDTGKIAVETGKKAVGAAVESGKKAVG